MFDAPRLSPRNIVTILAMGQRLRTDNETEFSLKALDKLSAMLKENPDLTLAEPEISTLMVVAASTKYPLPSNVLENILSVAPQLSDLRTMGSLLTGLAKLGLKTEFAEAAKSVEPHLTERVVAGDPNFLNATASIILYAYAIAETPCSPDLAKALVARMADMAGSRNAEEHPTMSHCSITMWSLARLGFADLFKEAESLLSPVIMRHLLSGRCTEQNISNILISASNLGVTLQKPLLKQLVNQFKSKSKDCSAQALANSLNALANWQMDTEFQELAEDITPLLKKFDTLPLANAQAASTVLWSHSACLVELDGEAMTAVMKALENDVDKANTR